MARAVAVLRAASVAVLALFAFDAAAAETIPQSKASRELVRRILLDACVYQEAAKEDFDADKPDEKADAKAKSKAANIISAKQQKIVDACQCASTRAMKPVTDEEIVKVDENRQVPDAWYSATTEAYASCKR
ncbi:MAG: hypothetical protein LWW93_11820 [Hyphomicrobiales bacterium]|nr:hypothetical protein [Hyphomicrobiales bacterium]